MGLKIAQEPKTAKVKNLMPKVGWRTIGRYDVNFL
jgi:hypothetical protein